MAAEPTARVLVVGYDGSPPSRDALEYAARRAGPDGHVYVVHSFEPPSDWLGHPNYQRVLEEHEGRGRELLEAVEQDNSLGTHVHSELLAGDAAEAIVTVADARHADEIAVGARRLGRIRAALGSVSLDVVHRARIPVVVIPARGES
jgi:nucleotide-binding universal stress UspA family protein